jgi:outer membrane protein OmpA-like peptidoglycan-associated protein
MRRAIAAIALAGLVLAGCQLFGAGETKKDDGANAQRTTQPVAPAAPRKASPRARAPGAGSLSPEIASYMDKGEADLRARLLAAGVSVARRHGRIVITMESDTTFAAGSDKVQPQFYQVLVSLGEILTRYDRTKIEISGHVDSVAGERGQALSRRQADAVAAVLRRHGVAQTRLRTEGAGKARPVASNATSAGRAKNRRVEIQILPPSA